QHQIRKHAALAKHPIVGDKRYNEEKYNLNIEKFYQGKRMCLHAEKLTFIFLNKEYIFESKISFDHYFSVKG
ncbi:MAG: RluA family pseudouridine synthase, partial [Pseudobdellovibrio sp.]